MTLFFCGGLLNSNKLVCPECPLSLHLFRMEHSKAGRKERREAITLCSIGTQKSKFLVDYSSEMPCKVRISA